MPCLRCDDIQGRASQPGGTVRKLAVDKSYLQLIIRLMTGERRSRTDNTVENMLKKCRGCDRRHEYHSIYVIDSDIYYADVYGERKKLDSVADSLVKRSWNMRVNRVRA